MADPQITEVDERTTGWEYDSPVFRVYLQDAGSTEDVATPAATATYDVTGADLLQVVDWAQDRASGSRTYAIALVLDEGRGLVWLIGADANSTSDLPAELDAQRRMRARRTSPVGIPVSDRMPPDVRGDEAD
ncbi:hypothetical protein [Nocardioides daeguensis]|uniref:Uncharacterized protein n=1 Tax=Nocardioides daeguensis TaxID=908359 RepID=A0ABP6UVT7_9ACTN|nr:hypothetical protein [Nocardioides daeguensis]MBV6725615.1 hypothetical protein [Nocardioides daeguensis]MCR1772870.1 hypothetical protein [Nocardioides daeguensis]